MSIYIWCVCVCMYVCMYILVKHNLMLTSNSTFDVFGQIWLNYITSTHKKNPRLAAITNAHILESVW